LMLTASIALSPATGAAQAPENPSTTNAAITAQQSDISAPLQHLREAERLLNGIPQDSPKLKKDARKKVGELRERFAGLVKAYQANGDPFVPAAVDQQAVVKPEKDAAPVNWKMSFSEVESDLAGILGGGSSLPPSTRAGAGSIVVGAAAPAGTTPAPVATTTTAVATTGATAGPQTSTSSDTTPASSIGTVAAVGEIGIKDLDPEIRRQLEQFRLEVELFFAATTMNFQSEAR